MQIVAMLYCLKNEDKKNPCVFSAGTRFYLLLKIFLKIYFYLMYMSVFPACVHVVPLEAGALRGQKRTLDPPNLELQSVVSLR